MSCSRWRGTCGSSPPRAACGRRASTWCAAACDPARPLACTQPKASRDQPASPTPAPPRLQVSLDLQPSWEPYLHALPEPDGVEPEAIYGAAKGGGAAKAKGDDDDDDDGDLPPVASLFGLGARKASWADAMDDEDEAAEEAAAAAKVAKDAARAKADAEGRDTYRFAQWDIKAGVTAQDAAGGTLDLCLVSNVLVYCTDEPSADVLAALLTSGVQAILLNERGAEQKMVTMDARTPTPTPTPTLAATLRLTPTPTPNLIPNPNPNPTRTQVEMVERRGVVVAKLLDQTSAAGCGSMVRRRRPVCTCSGLPRSLTLSLCRPGGGKADHLRPEAPWHLRTVALCAREGELSCHLAGRTEAAAAPCPPAQSRR